MGDVKMVITDIQDVNNSEELKELILGLIKENKQLRQENMELKEELDSFKPTIDLNEMERQYREYYSES